MNINQWLAVEYKIKLRLDNKKIDQQILSMSI
jgi:hypothetical protein